MQAISQAVEYLQVLAASIGRGRASPQHSRARRAPPSGRRRCDYANGTQRQGRLRPLRTRQWCW